VGLIRSRSATAVVDFSIMGGLYSMLRIPLLVFEEAILKLD